MPRLLFHDGNATIAYVPPVGWTFAGGETKLRLTPRDREEVTAIIQSVPQGSQEVQILSEQCRLLNSMSVRLANEASLPSATWRTELADHSPASIATGRR